MIFFSWNKRKKEKDRYKTTLAEFNRSLSLIIDPDQLKANIISKIQDIIRVNKIFLFIYNEDYHRYMLSDVLGAEKSDYSRFYFSTNDKLIYWMSINEKPIYLADKIEVFNFFSRHEQNMLEKMGVRYIHPLKSTNRLIGFIFLDEKQNGGTYKKNETELLEILLDQAAFAIENANLYKSQKDRIKRMYRADRLAVLGQLAAGAAHEIRNPLTSIRSTIQYIQNDIQEPAKAKMANELLNEVDRINSIIHGLLSFSNPNRIKSEEANLKAIIDQTLVLIENKVKKKQCKIKIENNVENSNLMADSSQLKQVFLNILINALDAIHTKGTITIKIDIKKSADNEINKPIDEYIINFLDDGKGMSPNEMEKIFDPFYTTKDDGTGLGLSISYGIIIQHGGDISIDSEPDKGTNVMVKLPAN